MWVDRTTCAYKYARWRAVAVTNSGIAAASSSVLVLRGLQAITILWTYTIVHKIVH